MVRLKPEERWNGILLERFEAFRISGGLKRLRDKGLRALGRRRRLKSSEYRKLPLHKDQIFLKQLFYHVRELGIPVYVQESGHKTAPIFLNHEFVPSPLPNSHKPSIHDVFTVELEFPPIFPPEARQQIAKDTDDIKRELLKRLGYRVPKRLRTTTLISKASRLRLNKSRLAKRELYEIVAETSKYATEEEDKRRRKTSSSLRALL